MRKFLFEAANRADMDTALAASQYMTLTPADEQLQHVDVAMPGTLNGQDVSPTYGFDFLASTVAGWTLPHTINRQVPYDWAGLSGNASVAFTVTAVTPFTRRRENWLDIVVNGQHFEVRADGGFDLVPAAGVEIWDFEANGWPLVNKKAVYDANGNQTSAPQVTPRFFIVMTLQGQIEIDDTLDTTGDIFVDSALAKGFKANGTELTYSRTATQTDWGSAYTIHYWERVVGGATVGMVDPATLPAEIIAQHGILQGL